MRGVQCYGVSGLSYRYTCCYTAITPFLCVVYMYVRITTMHTTMQKIFKLRTVVYTLRVCAARIYDVSCIFKKKVCY